MILLRAGLTLVVALMVIVLIDASLNLSSSQALIVGIGVGAISALVVMKLTESRW